MEPISAEFALYRVTMEKAIRAITPLPRLGARPEKGSGWGFDEDENGNSPFAIRMRALTKHQDNSDEKGGRFTSFENSAFNIISGKTNYTLMELASPKEAEQLELFKNHVPIYKGTTRS